MVSEIWKDVKGFEGVYQVSNLGRVRGVDRDIKCSNGSILHFKGKDIRTWIKDNGYVYVDFYINGKQKHFYVHRLVASAFIPNYDEEKTIINHKDEDKTNNRIENLEWCTHVYNLSYGTAPYRRGIAISNGNKKRIRNSKGEEFESVGDAALKYNCNASSISNNLKGRTLSCVGLNWYYCK